MKSILQIIDELKKANYISAGKNPYAEVRPLATLQDIEDSELECRVTLPNAYKTFVREYSNGLQLLEKENVFGVGKENGNPFHDNFTIYTANVILRREGNDEIEVKPCGRNIQLSKLVCFSAGNMEELSEDCWVFICDETFGLNEHNEYRIGYLAKHNQAIAIILVLDSFEQWLNILWNYNQDKLDHFNTKMRNVLSVLIPVWDQRMDFVEFIIGMDELDLNAIEETIREYTSI